MSEGNIDFDELARQCFAAGDYKNALILGERALEEDPGDARLQQNIRWYNSALDRRAYITLLSNNSYINGVVVLDQSLKLLGNKYLLYCIVTPEVSQENIEVLQKLDIPIILKDPIIPIQYKDIPPKEFVEFKERGYHKGLTKLCIFGLDMFSKLVYIDADIIVKQNIDELFDKPHMSACWDGGLDPNIEGYSGSFNSGLMVIEPNEAEFQRIMTFMDNFDPQDQLIHDQLILQKFYSDWNDREELHLDRWYAPWTTSFVVGWDYYYYYMESKAKTIHMIDVKPWKVTKQYFYDYMLSYPYYAALNLKYIDILNYTIRELQRQGVSSSNLNIIE